MGICVGKKLGIYTHKGRKNISSHDDDGRNTAAEISAIERSSVKGSDADLLQAWMLGKVTEATTIESCG